MANKCVKQNFYIVTPIHVCNPHITVHNPHIIFMSPNLPTLHTYMYFHSFPRFVSPPPLRVLFGSSHLYVFHHPKELAQLAKEGRAPKPVTYDFAQEEIAQEKGFDMSTKGKSIGVYVCLLLLGYKCTYVRMYVCTYVRMYVHYTHVL